MEPWNTPSVVEVPVGLEIGAYAPAELDGTPQGTLRENETKAPQPDRPLGQDATNPRRSSRS